MTTTPSVLRDLSGTGVDRVWATLMQTSASEGTKPEREESRSIVGSHDVDLIVWQEGTTPYDEQSFERVVVEIKQFSPSWSPVDVERLAVERLAGLGATVIIRQHGNQAFVYAAQREPSGSADELRQRAMQLPATDVPDRPPTTLGTDLRENARALFDLTNTQLAEVLGVTERQLYRMGDRLSDERRERLGALSAVGVLLAGSLGPAGRWKWMQAGDPSGLQLLRDGRTRELRERAEALRDSVAT